MKIKKFKLKKKKKSLCGERERDKGEKWEGKMAE